MAARGRVSISQQALADAIGVSRGSIGLYETRKRKVPIAVARRWAEACGAHLHVLVVGDEDPLQPLAPEDRRLLELLSSLAAEDRALIENLAIGLKGAKPELREMIAAQVPILLGSARSSGDSVPMPAARAGSNV